LRGVRARLVAPRVRVGARLCHRTASAGSAGGRGSPDQERDSRRSGAPTTGCPPHLRYSS
jgi:hypothetical protein